MPQNTSPNYVPGADQGTAEGLAAPGRAGVGGTNNESQWLSIADFLARQNLRAVLQERARGAEGAPACGEAASPRAAIIFGGYAGAGTSSVPVGNTGTTSTGRGV